MKRFVSPLFCAALLVSGIACNGKEKPVESKPTPEVAPVQQVQPTQSSKPRLSKLVIKTVKPGKGAGAAKGDLIWVRYTGRLADGAIFDTNDKKEAKLFLLQLGFSPVIRGWTEGLTGIKKGEQRDLEIPADMAYGKQGAGPIPADADLYFHVEAVDMVPVKESSVVDIKDVKVGTGREVKKGDTIKVKYVGTFLEGNQFDAGEVTIKVGDGTVVPGFDVGVVGMKVGGVRKLHVPPGAGYGNAGRMPRIPGSAVLLFEVTLESIK